MKMKPQSALLFAQWLADNEPQIFQALKSRAGPAPKHLAGVLDFLSSIGSGISNAVQDVGSYLTSDEGAKTVSALVGAYQTYQTAQAQQSVLAVQLARAQAGQAPAPIQNVPVGAGNIVPINATTGVPLTSAQLAAYHPSVFQQYGPWIVAGGAALLLIFTLGMRT